MKNLLIIPDRKELKNTLLLADEYNLGFEYNDFVTSDVLDSDECTENIVSEYKKANLPGFTTIHGAFFDVVPFSIDKKIKEISLLRINQSLQSARKIGAKAVVFHTNYNPFLNSTDYIDNWIKQNTEIWRNIVSYNKDISIYLENTFEFSPDILKRLAEDLSVNENFGICLDWAHAVISPTAPLEWARELGEYVKHIHINDNDLKSDQHLAWGNGKINRFEFYDCFEKHFNKASVLIETSAYEDKLKSLEQLKNDGFIK